MVVQYNTVCFDLFRVGSIAMARKTKQDWYAIAYSSLIESGVEAISAEKLATKLGVSRGSFYHHFGSRQGFHKALLENWLQLNTMRINELNQGKSATEKLRGLKDFAWALPHKLEVAIRAWSLYDEQAREYQIKTDHIRLAYLTDLFEEKYNKTKAKKAAEVLFYSFIGLQNRQPAPSSDEFHSFKDQINQVLEHYLLS